MFKELKIIFIIILILYYFNLALKIYVKTNTLGFIIINIIT
jgi:hypothetical protein